MAEPSPLTPLIHDGMTEAVLAEYLDYAREPETPMEATATIISLGWELRDQRQASATKDAEIAALRAALAERPASLSTPQMAAIATALKEECEKQHARAERAEAQVQAARRSALEEAIAVVRTHMNVAVEFGVEALVTVMRHEALRASPGESEEPTK